MTNTIKGFIPHVERMLEKEEMHLQWLIEHNAPLKFIVISEGMTVHIKSRLKEYRKYVES